MDMYKTPSYDLWLFRKTLTMANPAVGDPPPPQNPNLYTTTTTTDFDALPIPPLDPTFFSEDLMFSDHDPNSSTLLSFDKDDVVGDLDFDFTFDDVDLPSDTDDFLNPGPIDQPANPVQIESIFFDQAVYEPEFCHFPGDRCSSGARSLSSAPPEFCKVSDDQLNGARVLNSGSPESSQASGDRGSGVSGYLNMPSSESSGIDRDCYQESGNKDLATCDREVSGPASSQGSGNSRSNISETLNCSSSDSGNCPRSVNSSPNFADNSISGVVDQKIKLEDSGNNSVLKRKKEDEVVKIDSRTSKFQRSNTIENATSGEEEKKNARLMRNRESAQLSRQRKKHYVEELEDKVRTMHSTIQDLNAKISYIMSENVSLRQQMGGGGGCPPPMPPPGMYPHPSMAPMAYPWMSCTPYMIKPQGSQVPLVPIPRLKSQQSVSAQKAKREENKKTGGKTKKVASVSFLGFLIFILLFGGLVPMVNVKYGGTLDPFTGELDYAGNRFYDQHRGSVLRVNGHLNGTDHNIGMGFPNEKFGNGQNFTNTIHYGRGHDRGAESNTEQKERGSNTEFVHSGNASEPLVASLYVPRNDKLVKIDGNLIIHSVLASEKAMASRGDLKDKGGRETGLAVAGNLAPAIPYPGSGRHPNLFRSPSERQKALASGSAEGNFKSTAADGKLQQWFREGLAGPMLTSGMCTEVFQFDVSPASASGAIIPATSARNISSEHHQNSTHLNKGRNRRILHGLPIPLAVSSQNITTKHMGRSSEKENFHGNNSVSSMVVSVLVDPREAGDGDGDGMMGSKSLSRIFVVVLLDGIKYVTYSCVLPLKGSGPHLVTT